MDSNHQKKLDIIESNQNVQYETNRVSPVDILAETWFPTPHPHPRTDGQDDDNTPSGGTPPRGKKEIFNVILVISGIFDSFKRPKNEN